MKFTELEQKLIILAMDNGAAEAEQDTAACKLIDVLKRRYSDGYAFLNEMNQGPNKSDYNSELAYSKGFQAGYQKAKDESNAYNRTYRSNYRRNYSSGPRTETIGTSDHISGDAVIHFGKHKGQQIRKIPLEYCIWALDTCSNLDSDLKANMKEWLRVNGK